MLCAGLLSDSAGEPVEFGSNGREFLIACPLKGSDDLVIRRAFDRTRSKDSRFTTGRLNLLFQPLKILVRFFIRRKDIDRILDCDRPEFLKFAPDANAQVRWLRGQLMNQQYPLML